MRHPSCDRAVIMGAYGGKPFKKFELTPFLSDFDAVSFLMIMRRYFIKISYIFLFKKILYFYKIPTCLTIIGYVLKNGGKGDLFHFPAFLHPEKHRISDF